MKVIVCGAGQVGFSIASYLSEEGNSVTVIDKEPALVAQVNDTLEASGILGHASYPDTLEAAGAEDADMLIAATHVDEVNMLACQVGHTLFNIPIKIARIREQGYLNPVWGNLFSRDHMPIDAIISPEIEVAKAIANRIRVPGSYNIIPLADGRVQMVSVICKEDCPLTNTPLKHLTPLFPDLSVVIMAIVRGDEKIIPDGDELLLAGDEVYFVAATEHLHRAMSAFGCSDIQTRRVLITGAGKIGTRLAMNIQATMPEVTVRMIEANEEAANFASEKLTDATVLYGDAMNKDILEEANIRETETVVAVTNHDESNILVSMLAKQYGCERTVTLVNNSSFSPLIASMGIDAVVNPRSITVSTILQHVRRGRIRNAHSLRDGFAEVLELEALDTSAIVNTPLREVKRPEGMILGLIVRDENILIPKPDMVIKPDDRVIVLAAHDSVKKVEQMFAVRPEYF